MASNKKRGAGGRADPPPPPAASINIKIEVPASEYKKARDSVDKKPSLLIGMGLVTAIVGLVAAIVGLIAQIMQCL